MSDMADVMKNLWDEHEYVFASDDEGFIFAVDKLGGGTLHKQYIGGWQVTVYRGLGEWVGEVPFNTGTPHSHMWVALAAAGMFS